MWNLRKNKTNEQNRNKFIDKEDRLEVTMGEQLEWVGEIVEGDQEAQISNII